MMHGETMDQEHAADRSALIAEARITRFSFPRDRVIGDSQVHIAHCNVAVLELSDGSGRTGTGLFQDLFTPLPDEDELQRQFRLTAWPRLHAAHPAGLLNRISRPRGGNRRAPPFNMAEAIDQALWDLHAQQLGLPLWRLLGGIGPGKVRAYASGLEFHLSDAHFVAFFGGAKEKGFDAFKVKIGHPDLAWDLRRLKLLRETVGEHTLMVDSNEAWSGKEAVRRLHAYADAGHVPYWAEDPCMRDDFAALRFVRENVPFCHVNAGEYLDLSGKRALIEAKAVDILNIHGRISDSMKAAWLAAEAGIEVSLGNTSQEMGVHIACALPECRWLEYSFQNTAFLTHPAIRIEAGWAHAPDRPGHGLRLTEAVRQEYRAPRAGDATPAERAPPGPILLPAA